MFWSIGPSSVMNIYDLKSNCNELKVFWNLRYPVNFSIIVTLEYDVFYFVYLSAINFVLITKSTQNKVSNIPMIR